MNLIERVKNKIFKCNLQTTVDYHAEAFFIKKKVAYLIFRTNNDALIYLREEGLHPNDNNSAILIHEIDNQEDLIPYLVSQPNKNINLLKLSSTEKELLCMPSLFIENVNMERLTEIALDKFGTQTLIFNLVAEDTMAADTIF